MEGWAPDLQPDPWALVHGAQVEVALLVRGGSKKSRATKFSFQLPLLPAPEPQTTDGQAAAFCRAHMGAASPFRPRPET